MTDSYLYLILALLPLSAVVVVVQRNPYHALVLRGILGAIAALVYATLGAADVALTEALVGTMLAITLYAVAVRSSMVMRLGILQADLDHMSALQQDTLIRQLQIVLSKQSMRLKLVPHTTTADLEQALREKSVHTIAIAEKVSPEAESSTPNPELTPDPLLHLQSEDSPSASTYQLLTRVPHLYKLLQEDADAIASMGKVTWMDTATTPAPVASSATVGIEEVRP